MGSITLLLPVLIAIAVIVIVARLGRDARVIRLSAPAAEAAQRASTRVQWRNRVAIVAGLLVAVAVGTVPLGIPEDLGRAALLAPAVGATVAMLVFVLIPSAEFLESNAVRQADLRMRQAWDYARVWPVYAALAASSLVLLVLGVLGDSEGRTISHHYGDQAGATAGPYPGWFYLVPILVAVVVQAALTDLALRRVARAPRPSDRSLREADEAVRGTALQLIVRIGMASVLVTLGAALIGAGNSTMAVSDGVEATIGGKDASLPGYAPLYALGIVELILGVVAVGAGLALVLMAVRLATRRAFTVGAAR